MDAVPKQDLIGFAQDLRAVARTVAPTLSGRGKVPLVLAYAPTWTAAEAGESDLAGIRAELRGLGADLVVLSDGGVWSFHPDDDAEQLASIDQGAHLRALGLRRGVDLEGKRHAPLALFVFDGDAEVRFAEVLEAQRASLGSGLRAALSTAGRRTSARPSPSFSLSRREWLLGNLIVGLAVAFGCKPPPGRPAPADTGAPPEAAHDANDIDVLLDVNGVEHRVRLEPRVTLLDALRERMGLTGTKKGCDHGQCGACTVLVDERRVCSCLTLAVAAQGSKIVTIEGLATGDALHPVQQAFIALDGLQCGYCTPGQIMSAVGLLREGHAQSDDEVREQMSGNICRCGAYPNIVAAVQLARRSV